VRVAIIHYWLLRMRGGEKVVESLCRLLPEADLFTLFYNPAGVSATIRSHRVTASFLNPARAFYRALLPLAPLALEQFDLRGYDLVISSESGPAKGVLVSSAARHVCYCHSPMRYLWEQYPDYSREWVSRWKRPWIAPVAHWLRLWDYATAARVDEFLANSDNVRNRIRRAWGREARVIHPPVAVETFYSRPAEDYFLIVGELVRYKRVDLAVRLFSRTGRKLRIAGEGPEYRRLRRLASANVEFCGHVSDDQLRELYARCRALVMPGEEDFGLTAVEAMASGKAVIALGRGGVPEIVPEGGGFFFQQPLEEDLAGAVASFERREPALSSGVLISAAARFSESEFHRKMREALRLPAAQSATDE